jgi:hypothetical protein
VTEPDPAMQQLIEEVVDAWREWTAPGGGQTSGDPTIDDGAAPDHNPDEGADQTGEADHQTDQPDHVDHPDPHAADDQAPIEQLADQTLLMDNMGDLALSAQESEEANFAQIAESDWMGS